MNGDKMNLTDYTESLKLAEERSFEVLLGALLLRGNFNDRGKIKEVYPYHYELIMNSWREDLRRYEGVGQ